MADQTWDVFIASETIKYLVANWTSDKIEDAIRDVCRQYEMELSPTDLKQVKDIVIASIAYLISN